MTREETKFLETELDSHGRMNIRNPTIEETKELMDKRFKLKNTIVTKDIKWHVAFRLSTSLSDK